MKLVAVTASAFIHEQERWRAAGFDDVIVKPVLSQRLCLSLSTLPNVEFHRTAQPNEKIAASRAQRDEAALESCDSIGLPEELRNRMLAAAEVHGITALKQCIDHAQQVAPAAAGLCDRLRRSLHDYDMRQIVDLLTRQTPGTTATSDEGNLEPGVAPLRVIADPMEA